MGTYLSLSGRGRGGRLFEVGCLLTFSAFRMGAYSRRAIIRGWALMPINTVPSRRYQLSSKLLRISFAWFQDINRCFLADIPQKVDNIHQVIRFAYSSISSVQFLFEIQLFRRERHLLFKFTQEQTARRPCLETTWIDNIS